MYFLDYHISAKHIELIQTLLNKEKTGHYINLPGNHICYRSNKTLIFMHQKELNKDIAFSISVKQINKIYEIPILNHKIKFTLLTTSPLNIKSSKTSAYIQLDPKKPIHFIIRSLTPSDEYKPYGRSYSKIYGIIYQINNVIGFIKKEFQSYNTMKPLLGYVATVLLIN